MVAETTDYRLAGFLDARGARFIGTKRNGRGETVFRFEGDDGTEALLNEYPVSAERRYDASCQAMNALTRVKRSRE